MKKIILTTFVVILIISTACQKTDTEVVQVPDQDEDLPKATIVVNETEKMTLELYPSNAPNTVNNFIELAERNFYDGLIFHRVIEGFMIQGGDPNADGTGGPGYSIKGEFSDNGFDNNLSHGPGVISMARSRAYDSAGSQFFIMHEEATSLDHQYAAFGKIIEGMDVVNKIATTETNAYDKPMNDFIITDIIIDLGSYQPDPVKKIE